MDGLVALGDAAVPGLVERMGSTTGGVGIAAFLAVTKLAAQRRALSLSPASIEAIKGALLSTLKSQLPPPKGGGLGGAD